MKDGIYKDLPIDDYHGKCGGISKSGVSKFLKAPTYYKAYVDEELVQTDALRVGRIVHQFMLEPELFNEDAVYSGRRAGDWWKKFHAAYCEEYLLKKEYDELSAMREALMRHPRAVSLIMAKGETEVSSFWNDPETGLLCKTRPDRIAGDIFIDYKTCTDSSPRGFSKAVFDYGYHLQAGMAKDGFKANGHELNMFCFIAQEKKAPYNTEVYYLDSESVEKGVNDYKKALVGIKECQESGLWNGYNDNEAVEIGLPYYAYKDDE